MEENQVKGRGGGLAGGQGLGNGAPEGRGSTDLIRVNQIFQTHHSTRCVIKKKKFWLDCEGYLAYKTKDLSLIRARLSQIQ